ncbi:MAG TPA: hypothetical protein VEI03_04865 [Stellaceae bacterium]|nr:hypothetical protein [Stellaceae bacterium]
MDEESIGIFGMLLIVTALVMSQTVFHHGYAAPALTTIKWEDVMNVFGCDQEAGDGGCTVAMNQ